MSIPRSPAKKARPKKPAAVVRAADATPDIIPAGRASCDVRVSGRTVSLTNLKKPFWPELGITKGDLLRYYVAVAPALLPHLKDRAMVMKRYPNGAAGKFFFMKRAPDPRPSWIRTCAIEHESGSVIDFPMVQDLPSLLWLVNLGCIDLNPWYSRCDDTNRPDYLHFDLDPVPGADFARVREVALLVRDALAKLGMKTYPKTTGSKGIHVYVPIVRGPTQKRVWAFAKEFARVMEAMHPGIITAEYRIARRPAGRVLVDYNQNAWGRTLAYAYSIRPRPGATASAPVTWDEVEAGVEMDDFRIDNLPARVARVGDLWRPLLQKRGRFDLEKML
ncbi:MAG TPA: non-homologous end-joining DNA ligase [Longimicrobiaceae bacterium]|jgi:bifunctional non-homologous end joining protein LigD|nr:non-homologous end-joining DNA ligase [Longimicrobiaceae bacterium]